MTAHDRCAGCSRPFRHGRTFVTFDRTNHLCVPCTEDPAVMDRFDPPGTRSHLRRQLAFVCVSQAGAAGRPAPAVGTGAGAATPPTRVAPATSDATTNHLTRPQGATDDTI